MTPLEVEALVLGYDVPSLVDVVDRPGWMADAACREHPEVSFFPARGESSDPAKAVCAGCLVRAECLAYALEMPLTLTHGIWGATSDRERRRMRRDAAA